MGFFECCHYCPSTKRHPGCHSECPDYKEQKALSDRRRDIIYQKRLKESQVRPAKTDYLNKAVWHDKKY